MWVVLAKVKIGFFDKNSKVNYNFKLFNTRLSGGFLNQSKEVSFIKNLLIAVAVVVIVVGAGFFLLKGGQKTETKTETTNQETQTSTPNPPATEENQTGMIAYADGKFSPSSLTVKSGSTVTIMNKSSDVIQVDSNPHPAHTDNTELNVGTIGASETRTFTITKAGSWRYHNHLESSEGGTIIVE